MGSDSVDRQIAGLLERVRPELSAALEERAVAAIQATRPLQQRPRYVSRMRLLAGGLCVLALSLVMLLALFVWTPGAKSVAWAQIADALSTVTTVHMTGWEGDSDLVFRTDKWIRLRPLAVYQEVTPVDPQTVKEASRRHIFAGDAEKTYWYFPERGNRAIIGKGLQTDFMGEVLSPLEWSDSSGQGAELKVIGRSRVEGRAAILLELPGWKERTELAVDARTKLALRLRQFSPSLEGADVEVTRLDFEYDTMPPEGIFNWAPPVGAVVEDKR